MKRSDLDNIDLETTFPREYLVNMRRNAVWTLKRIMQSSQLISAGRIRTLTDEMESMGFEQVADLALGAIFAWHRVRMGLLTKRQAIAMFKLPASHWPYDDESLHNYYDAIAADPDLVAETLDCYEHNGDHCPLCSDFVGFLRNEDLLMKGIENFLNKRGRKP